MIDVCRKNITNIIDEKKKKVAKKE